MFLLKYLPGNKFRQLLSFSLKLAIIIAAIVYIWQKIVRDTELVGRPIESLLSSVSYNALFFVFLLMLLNWGIEAMKWKLLIQKLEAISFLNSFKAVLTGVTVSIFTPNRVGEFGGRIFFLEKENRIQGTLLSFLGSTAQLLVTIIAGAIAFLFYAQHYLMTGEEGISNFLYVVLASLIVFVLSALVFFFLKASYLVNLLRGKSFYKRIEKYVIVFADYPSSALAKVLFLSLLRYLVFTMQFYLLLQLFNVHVAAMEGMLMIALTFFVITAIPTFAFTELGIRGSAALLFIGMLSGNSIGIISASFALWIVNIASPALIGSFFVFKLRFFERRI